LAPVVINQTYRHQRYVEEDSLRETEQQLAHDVPNTNLKDFSKTHKSLEHGGYFEVLVVGEDAELDFSRVYDADEHFHYEQAIVSSFEEAVCAVLFNPTIQAVLIRGQFKYRCDDSTVASNAVRFLKKYSQLHIVEDVENLGKQEGMTLLLASVLTDIRPELDIYLFTDLSVEKVALAHKNAFRRVFYNEKGDVQELHLSIIEGVKHRFETPFFNALKKYATHPTGVFHALPISRASSLTHAHWAKDMLAFYGANIFLAETSATIGGLDSLLEPTGTIKHAQQLAAEAFGADRTFWVTNGTSTANKIVVQGLVAPNDIVLVDRNCHKSHHLGLSLVGASVVYLEAYPLQQYAMYGAVPLRTIKKTLLDFKAAGTLHRVKMLLLTNCTFDGIVYNVRRVMEECLAIKPDLVFLWDEAWWGFARFHYLLRERTAMFVAQVLREKYATALYRKEYQAWKEKHTIQTESGTELDLPLDSKWLPDPDKVRIRVYATQSTHKTLTALRQGSMIHVSDCDFKRLVERPFIESFFTHTSTSPNYQILASLDVGRRQVALEGFELVQKHLEKSLILRKQAHSNQDFAPYFHFLDVSELIPAEFRVSGLESYATVSDNENAWAQMDAAWVEDEFALDPNRLTLHTGKAGVDGDTFKNKYLMDHFQIQVNKTSINSVLIMLTIGTTRSSIAYLNEALVKIAEMIKHETNDMSSAELQLLERKKKELTEHLPHLPNFSHFHPKFRKSQVTEEGVLRDAFFAAYVEDDCEYVPLRDKRLDNEEELKHLVSASFVIPYPPGFPILVPGQLISSDVIDFFRHLDVHEVHGYNSKLGLRVFKQHVLQ